MRIMKCLRCGKFIHEARKCYHCGNTEEFNHVEEPCIHESVSQEYRRVESLIGERKFGEATTLSHRVIEMMPNLAVVFWLRVLSKYKCVTAEELIMKGFPCENDPDFCNALKFSSGAEHKAYEDIQDIVIEARKELMRKVQEHENDCKLSTNLLKLKESIPKELERRKKTLFSLWDEVKTLEYRMCEIEWIWPIVEFEHFHALNSAFREAEDLEKQIYQMEECTHELFHKYQVKFGSLIEQSEQAKNAIDTMRKQHEWVKQFAELSDQREGKMQQISSEISSLKNYELTIQRTLSEIDKIEECHKKVFLATEKYEFAEAVALLGKDIFNQIMKNEEMDIKYC